ncbi:MAG: 4Fe-4S binding protein [Bacteroidetes bacterium]|nr:4Fe-4S binding protein [Bacteroidota bacterium]
MKAIRYIGLAVFLIGLSIFTYIPFQGEWKLTQDIVEAKLGEQQQNNLQQLLDEEVIGKTYHSVFPFANDLSRIYKKRNEELKAAQDWDNIMWDLPRDFAYTLTKASGSAALQDNSTLWFLLSFVLGAIGAMLYILPDYILLGPPGIKNNGIFHSGVMNRGLIGILLGMYLIGFYIILYWFPAYIVNWVFLMDPISIALSGNPASQWFLYGFMYCSVMAVMGVRMFIKYRHNKYQLIRTTSVIFFQVSFAFLIPEILVRLNKPSMDMKNIWPLDYDFFFDWNLDGLIQGGGLGLFMLVWGIALFVIGVPVITYFFGKRWYCSWVCGCGGLAETLGDPFRQLSNKSVSAWKIERWMIHSVLVFAVVMTGFTLYTYFTDQWTVLGIETSDIQSAYGFLIGSAFAGVVGTGFYPFMGNRVWCRFGCPLAAYLGLVQKFKSRFRITTNGGQCISCGNCSTYCEMGIDVRWYAQRGQNIIRSSCVGCGVCAAVCPRGVLRLENGPEEGRYNGDVLNESFVISRGEVDVLN